jgi:hypothetical protein
MPRPKDYTGPMCGAAPKPGGVRTWPCKIPPMEGEKRCRMHGGKHAGNATNKAKARTSAKVQKALRKLNITPVEDPLTALKTLAGEAVAWKNEMSRLVAELTQIRYRTENSEQVRAEVALFERAMDRCTTVLATIAKLNIDERLAAITEQQARMLTNALFAAFEAAGLSITDVEQKRQIASEFGRHLALVG